MQINIQIKNLPQIQAALVRSPQIVSRYINKAINRSIMDIRNASIDESPVRTGRLRGSYETRFGNLRGEIGPTVNYAIYVHEGHRQEVGRYVPAIERRLVQPYVRGNPFFRRAIDGVTRKINDNFGDGLKDALNEIARSI